MSELDYGLCDEMTSLPHTRGEGCKNWKPVQPAPTEMASLVQIKAKLDQSLNAEMNLALGINKLGEKLDVALEMLGASQRKQIEDRDKLNDLSESQGKLLVELKGIAMRDGELLVEKVHEYNRGFKDGRNSRPKRRKGKRS